MRGDALAERLLQLARTVPELAAHASEVDWDGNGGVAVSNDAWAQAFALYGALLVESEAVPAPTVAPCGDGSVHLFWAPPDGSSVTAEAFPSGTIVVTHDAKDNLEVTTCRSFAEAASTVVRSLGI